MNNHEHNHKKEELELNEENEQSECSCDCGEDCDCKSEDISVKEIAYHADDKIDALIHLLIKKNLISESEFEEEYNALFEESESDETEETEEEKEE
jgi:hypothetical protein